MQIQINTDYNIAGHKVLAAYTGSSPRELANSRILRTILPADR
jgi:hypothetical protein